MIDRPNEEDRFKLLRDHGELMTIKREGITDEMKRQLESYKRSVKIDFDITRDYMQCITTSKLPGWIITYAHCTVPKSDSKQEHHTVEVAQVNDNASASELQENSIEVKTTEYGQVKKEDKQQLGAEEFAEIAFWKDEGDSFVQVHSFPVPNPMKWWKLSGAEK